MPGKSLGYTTSADMATWFNAQYLEMAAQHAKLANTSLSKLPMPTVEGETEVTTQKKDPEAAAEAKLDKVINDTMKNVRVSINRKIAQQGLRDRLRNMINAEYAGILSPAEIDRHAKDAASSAAYKMSDFTVIPKSLIPSTFVTSSDVDSDIPYVAEQADLLDEGTGE